MSQATFISLWRDKVKNGDGQAEDTLLQEHYLDEVHDIRRASSATSKLEDPFWKSEAAFPFKNFLTQMIEAMKELEDPGQPFYPQEKYNSSGRT